MAIIDDLTIKVNCNAGKAVTNINNLASALGTLNQQVKGFKSNDLNGVSEALSGIGSAISGLTSSTKGLKNISLNVNNIVNSSVNFAKAGDAAQNFADKSKAVAEGVNEAGSAAKESAG